MLIYGKGFLFVTHSRVWLMKAQYKESNKRKVVPSVHLGEVSEAYYFLKWKGIKAKDSPWDAVLML